MIWRVVNHLINKIDSPILATIAIIPPAICVNIKLAESDNNVSEQITDLDIAEKDYVVIFVNTSVNT